MKISLWLLFLFPSFFLSHSSEAMPMFARKYKVDCAMCHAAVPRLNYTGFKFKTAGYRMAWEIGKDQEASQLTLENYTAFVAVLNAPLQVQLDRSTGQSTTSLMTSANEVDVHPMTGSWGKYWGSGFELDGLSTGSVSLNQSFLTFTSGRNDSFGTVQVGVVPNFLGYGALDRSVAVSTPLVLSQSANDSVLDTLFTWSGPRAAGLTGSYWMTDTVLSASVRNRLTNGTNGPDALGGSKTHMGDVLLSVTQFYDHTGSGSAVSAFYYKGLSQIPNALGGGAPNYFNSFNHLGLAANKYFSDQINITAGGGWSVDQRYDALTGVPDQSLHSFGSFAAAEYFFSPQLMAGARFDQFRTDAATPGTQILGGTAYTCWHVINWVILSGEYQYLHYGMNTATSFGINNSGGSVDQHTLTLQATVTF
jgi:hypothetical protein